MYSNQQKDVLIADLNRQIFEAKQRISPHLSQLRNLLKDSQNTIEQLQNNFYRSDQQQNQRNQQNNHLIESLKNEGQFLNQNIQEIENKFIIFKDERYNLEMKAQDIIDQIKSQSDLYSEHLEEWKKIVEEIENVKYNMNNEMFLKQQQIEEYEELIEQNQQLQSQLNEQELIQRELLDKLENIKQMSQEQVMTINEQNWIAKRIEKEEEQNQGQEYCLLEDIDRARVIIDKLRIESDETTNLGVQYQVAIERENETLYQNQAKVEHYQGLEKIKTQHVDELNIQLSSLMQENHWLEEDIQLNKNKYSKLSESVKELQKEIQNNLEQMIMKGYRPEFIQQIIKRRDKINQRIIENVSPQRRQNIYYSSHI